MTSSKIHEVKISHPQLGAIKGIVPIDGVHQFRSVPYATIPHRFADPVVVESLGADGVYDATKFGPIAPQPDNAEELEFPASTERLPHEHLEKDEFKCTNLNISVPIGERKSGDAGLPVMVWFHGGSFMLGAASWPQYGIPAFEHNLHGRFCQIRQVVCGSRTTCYWSWCQVRSTQLSELIKLSTWNNWIPCL